MNKVISEYKCIRKFFIERKESEQILKAEKWNNNYEAGYDFEPTNKGKKWRITKEKENNQSSVSGVIK